MANNRPSLFFCPNCQALYQVVKVEAGPETTNREIACRLCDAPFPAREGQFVLKYFMVRKPSRGQKWGRTRPTAS
jgi:hypothetical protein